MNSTDCPGCLSPIFNQTPSLIPSPFCVPLCPPSTGCSDILPTACILYNGGNLTCSGIATGDNLNIILSKIDLKLCNSIPPSGNCTVQVDSSDACCGYLIDKIFSNSLVVTDTTIAPSTCKVLTIETKPWVWTTLSLNSPITNLGITYPPASVGARCNGANCNFDDIRFKGFVQAPQIAFNGPRTFTSTITTLPPNFRPIDNKQFNYSYVSNVVVFVSVFVNSSTGAVFVTWNTISNDVSWIPQLSLDFIQFPR